ncbi:MAG: CapA family protein [Clostridia bacterium]|nr:CapA family protein [Clostridia bacterium]
MKKSVLWGMLALLLCLAGCASAGHTETSSPGSVSLPLQESSLPYEETTLPEPSAEESSAPGEISLPEEEISLPEEEISLPVEEPAGLPEALTTLFPVPEWEGDITAFGEFVEQQAGKTATDAMAEAMLAQDYSNDAWREFTGNSLHVWRALYKKEHETSPFVRLLSMGEAGKDKTTVMTFGGDICFAENYEVMGYMLRKGYDLEDCIAPEWFREMQNADIAVLNNEFSISSRGKPMKGKAFTFRADPKHTALYHRLGVDLVTLANNHVFDYGEDAFHDTLDTLREYGVDYAGAGRNAEEAQSPMYYLVDGRKIAFISATRAEKYILTPEATEDAPGVFRCYDTARLLEVIAKAKEESDYVILLVHWGREGSNELETVQKETAPLYLAAGVDLIVGAHAHRLQGIEFIDGKAVFYNLGNFWFDNFNIETGLMRFELAADGKETFYFLPAKQTGCKTSYEVGTTKGRTILDHVESYSKGISIRDDGLIVRE